MFLHSVGGWMHLIYWWFMGISREQRVYIFIGNVTMKQKSQHRGKYFGKSWKVEELKKVEKDGKRIEMAASAGGTLCDNF